MGKQAIAAADKATPNWRYDHISDTIVADNATCILQSPFGDGRPEDGQFAASGRADVPRLAANLLLLVAEVRRLEEDVAAYETAVDIVVEREDRLQWEAHDRGAAEMRERAARHAEEVGAFGTCGELCVRGLPLRKDGA